MALNKLAFISCSFLISFLLLITLEIRSIEARLLDSSSKKELQNLPNKSENNVDHKNNLHGKSTTEASSVVAVSPPPPQSGCQVDGAAQPPPPAHGEGGFRPTIPGHHGVGHSLPNNVDHKKNLHGKSTTEASSVIVVSPLPPQSGGQVDGAAQPPPPAHGVGGFRPTTPGHSPGVGNSLPNNVDHKNNLHGKSTTEASSVVAVSPPPPQSGGHVGGAAQPPPAAHGVDEFRPTTPGHSPGVGNSLQNNVDHKNNLHGKSTTEASSVVAVSPPPPKTGGQVGRAAQPPPPAHGVDDFRPTTPGHSPGVGHSLQN